MLRSVTLSVALSVLAAACALFEPPPSPTPGITRVLASVTNLEPFEVRLAIRTRRGVVTGAVLAGAVEPSRLAPGVTRAVTFTLPADDSWMLTVNGTEMFFGNKFDRCPGGTLVMAVSASGAGSGPGCERPQ